MGAGSALVCHQTAALSTDSHKGMQCVFSSDIGAINWQRLPSDTRICSLCCGNKYLAVWLAPSNSAECISTVCKLQLSSPPERRSQVWLPLCLTFEEAVLPAVPLMHQKLQPNLSHESHDQGTSDKLGTIQRRLEWTNGVLKARVARTNR